MAVNRHGKIGGLDRSWSIAQSLQPSADRFVREKQASITVSRDTSNERKSDHSGHTSLAANTTLESASNRTQLLPNTCHRRRRVWGNASARKYLAHRQPLETPKWAHVCWSHAPFVLCSRESAGVRLPHAMAHWLLKNGWLSAADLWDSTGHTQHDATL